MKNLFLALAILFSCTVFSGSAFAAVPSETGNNKLRYGNDLCEFVSSNQTIKANCERSIAENFDKQNVFELGLNTCVAFNGGSNALTGGCLIRAAQWIPDQDLKDRSDSCLRQNLKYTKKASCLKELFSQKSIDLNAGK
jgi:hypothetical protein